MKRPTWIRRWDRKRSRRHRLAAKRRRGQAVAKARMGRNVEELRDDERV